MSVIYILISISLALALLFFFIFIKSVKSGQFDDSYTPSVRMLFEDETKISSKKQSISKTKPNS
ncbi:MAG: cytochrome oxidase maturation protein, cbb3-type [Bacteroidetes bacterium MedPE-SWsnd-G1]|uniref:Cbb3-type cytochrome oxidase assembly protein CcoS n=1 Tax=Urechidicola vernalis TaxID=3075600 RepID=A0ABU2Y3W3_9FLAO|nr:cbb3-type cytochrome oxidase assembly protein CcoS [Urechidicola sp. P050]MDT0552889.1 cbb3-type cytochrome oxidase assembly protein CcoS [Urechidicola sp. P050]OIQ41820.1 MAG: cytochrome oxidase maturation protein, cbb3-type [Bacteroidetes bacterium MedPE-SWsnd-G1]